MNHVSEVTVPLPDRALANADWADAWAVTLDKPFDSARTLGEAIVSNFPRWTYPLLALRQIIMFPFGLKGTKDAAEMKVDKIGFFPVVSEEPRRVVAGFDDKHLDFRIIVETLDTADGQRAKLATIIRRHNWVGKVYLACILPFHRLIIQMALDATRKNRLQQ